MDAKLDNTQPIRPGEEIDLNALGSYLRLRLPESSGPLTIEQFPHGHSNLTYLLRCGSNEWVLRRPPFGNVVKSAHDMGREFGILSKLCDHYPPAPRPVFYCDDSSLGAPFYVMERRHGVVFRRGSSASRNLDAATVRKLCLALVDNLAVLHSLDYKALGLENFGRPEGFVERQVTGWIKRYRDAQTENVSDIEQLANWLRSHMPSKTGAAIIHNDYKFDNVMFDANDPEEIVAVLDWEMATLGDPLMDFGTTVAYWVEAGDPPEFQQTAVGPTNVPGSLTRREVIDRYAAQTGRGVDDILFYQIFGLFKIAVIVQQIYVRYVRGNTSDPRFARLNESVAVLSRQAVRWLEGGAGSRE
jgi:aminoglycoside phosphotransferase (APT) family kinase protein